MASVAALLLIVVAAVPNCPQPKGHGLLQFGGRSGSGILQDTNALGINPLLTWAELEPAEGQYDWRALDDALADAAAHDKRVVPRIYTNAGDFYEATPDWVFDAGAEGYVFDVGDDVLQPVPTDPVFTQKFGAFLSALGARYDGHPQIEFFQTNAGMGGYGEMIWAYSPEALPSGWSPDAQVETVRYWIDRWRAAFPRTTLAIMENAIGNGIGEELSAYAVERGFYLQANNPSQAPQSVAILTEHAPRTKIILEVENNGCQNATGAAFDAMLDGVFAYGFPIDYLVVCGESFSDSGQAARAIERLRK